MTIKGAYNMRFGVVAADPTSIRAGKPSRQLPYNNWVTLNVIRLEK
jgi:hypothetical protein